MCIGYSTLKRWYKNYRQHSLEAFLKVNPTGVKKSVISKQIHDALEEKLHNSSDPLLGYWDAVIWIESKFNYTINYQTIRNYMIKHFKTKLKTPRKSRYKKDDQAIEAFLKTARSL